MTAGVGEEESCQGQLWVTKPRPFRFLCATQGLTTITDRKMADIALLTSFGMRAVDLDFCDLGKI